MQGQVETHDAIQGQVEEQVDSRIQWGEQCLKADVTTGIWIATPCNAATWSETCVLAVHAIERWGYWGR